MKIIRTVCVVTALVLVLPHSSPCAENEEESNSGKSPIKRCTPPGHFWIMTSDGENLLIYSTAQVKPLEGNKTSKTLRQLLGKKDFAIVKGTVGDLNDAKNDKDDEIKFEPLFAILQLPGIYYNPELTVAHLKKTNHYAFEVHGGGSRFIDLAIVPDKEGEIDRKRSGHIQIKFTGKDKKEIVVRGIDLTEPCLFAQGEKVWLCGTAMPFVQEKIENLPDRFVWIAKADDLAEDMKATYLCGGEQPRAFATKDGIYCIVKKVNKGHNEERIGVLTLHYSEDGEKWETLEKKMPEIKCADYDMTVSPNDTIYLFACTVDKTGVKIPKLYKTEDIEKGWKEIELKDFTEVKVKSNFQTCFHKGKLVIAVETEDSKMAIAALPSEEIPTDKAEPPAPSEPEEKPEE